MTNIFLYFILFIAVIYMIFYFKREIKGGNCSKKDGCSSCTLKDDCVSKKKNNEKSE